MAFYTNVSVFKNDILIRGVSDDGKRIKKKVPYKPYLFVPDHKGAGEYKSLQGKALGKVEFETIREAREFQRKYENVENFDIYGLGNFVYTYIYDNFPGDMQYDISNINLANIILKLDRIRASRTSKKLTWRSLVSVLSRKNKLWY